MRPLADRCILVLACDAMHAIRLVGVLERAGADTVRADGASEAVRRIEQFVFDGAVIDCSLGAEGVAERLSASAIPFCVCEGAVASAWRPPVTTQVAAVAATLSAMLEGKG